MVAHVHQRTSNQFFVEQYCVDKKEKQTIKENSTKNRKKEIVVSIHTLHRFRYRFSV